MSIVVRNPGDSVEIDQKSGDTSGVQNSEVYSGSDNWGPNQPNVSSQAVTGLYVSALTAARNDGTPWTAKSQYTPGPGKNVAQITPAAPQV